MNVPSVSSEPFDADAEYTKKRVPNAKDDEMLRRALLVGDFTSAVAVCFRQDRLDDALLLATASGSPELFTATQEKYFQRRATSPLTPVMSAILKNELSTLVASCNIQQWRDTLAALCTYAKVEEFIPLCEALGDRLIKGMPEQNIEPDIHAAVLVYMCARATNKVINLWINQIFNSSQRLLAIEDLVQKSIILRRAVYQSTGVDSTLEGQPEAIYIAEYVSSLAEDGQLPCAASYAIRISPTIREQDPVNGTCGDVLRDRLLRSFSRNDFAYPSALAIQNSPFPYTIQQINPAPVAPVDNSFMNTTYPSAEASLDYSTFGNAPSNTAMGNYNNPSYGQPQQQQPITHGYPNANAGFNQPPQQTAYNQPQQSAYNQPQQSMFNQPPQQQTYNQAPQQPANTGYRNPTSSFPTTTAPAPQANPMQSYNAYGQQTNPVPGNTRPPAVTQPVQQQNTYQQPQQPMQTQPQSNPMMGFNPSQSTLNQSRAQPTPMVSQPPVQAQPSRPTAMPNPSVNTVTPFGATPTNPMNRPAASTTTQMFTPTNQAMNQQPTNTFSNFANAPVNTVTNVVPPPAPAPAPVPVNLPITPEVQYILDTFNNTIANLRSVANAMETRQLNDATTSVELIKTKYSNGLVNNEVLNKLRSIVDAVAAYDFKTAQKLSGEMATMDWNNTKDWQKGVRHIVTLGLIKSQGTR